MHVDALSGFLDGLRPALTIFARHTVGMVDPANARVIQIRDTLHLEQVMVSEAFRDELAARGDLTIVADAVEMSFDADGRLASV